jgi:hypothetical protein
VTAYPAWIPIGRGRLCPLGLDGEGFAIQAATPRPNGLGQRRTCSSIRYVADVDPDMARV